MPLIRISLLKGRSADAIRAIADGVHSALTETFNVPREDRFQVIEQLDPGALLYSSTYLDVHRTDGIVLVHIIASGDRDTPTKQSLYKAIVDRLSSGAGVRPEDVQIVITPNARPDWSFGNGVASYVPTEA